MSGHALRTVGEYFLTFNLHGWDINDPRRRIVCFYVSGTDAGLSLSEWPELSVRESGYILRVHLDESPSHFGDVLHRTLNG